MTATGRKKQRGQKRRAEEEWLRSHFLVNTGGSVAVAVVAREHHCTGGRV
jgi:hypothetical protein